MITKTIKTKKTFVKAGKKESPAKSDRYHEAVGRRKTAVARVRIFGKNGEIFVNGKEYKKYFTVARHQIGVSAPLKEAELEGKFAVEARVSGGGIGAQAEAVRHGISRALLKINPELKKPLKRAGFLTRDPRMVERKKYGLKKARRAPQWAKR
ncbi:MAG: 30S ribosomal protein S9 [Parcubacteria group bacterium]|nr:30S ribosomal protein S9 [Parcubacteria group bacterium]